MESQQSAVATQPGKRKKKKLALMARIERRVALWVVRRRAKRAYFVLSLWPKALAIPLIALALRHVPPRMNHALYWTSKGVALLYACMVLAEATWKANQRWKRLR